MRGTYSTMYLNNLVQPLIEIARSASKEVMAIYENEVLFGQVDAKADNSPLTLADKAAHQMIATALSELTPDLPILSEEGKQLPIEIRQNWKRFWLVDPLDGTKEFIKRNGEFTINIALIEQGHPILGVIHIPVSGNTYYGFREGGAFKVLMDGTVQQIFADSYAKSQTGLRFVCSRSHMSEAVKKYIEKFEQPQTLSMGSSLKFMLIAEGKADIYPRLAPTMEWDTGAAQAILEAAGGKVLKYENLTPLAYNKSNLLNPHFIALGNEMDQ